jgi:hypothetical protein
LDRRNPGSPGMDLFRNESVPVKRIRLTRSTLISRIPKRETACKAHFAGRQEENR